MLPWAIMGVSKRFIISFPGSVFKRAVRQYLTSVAKRHITDIEYATIVRICVGFLPSIHIVAFSSDMIV